MIISEQLGDPMKKLTRPTFNPEFRLEASQLVADQNYIIRAATQAMNVGISTMAKWVAQLKLDRQGKSYAAATPMTPDQLMIRELEKRIQRIEM
jgi:transposase